MNELHHHTAAHPHAASGSFNAFNDYPSLNHS